MEAFSYECDSGFGGSPPNSPLSETSDTLSLESVEPEVESYKSSVSSSFCLPDFNTMDYCSAFSNIQDDGCLGSLDFLFDEISTSIQSNNHNGVGELHGEEMGFECLVDDDDFFSTFQALDDISIDNNIKDFKLDIKEPSILDQKSELDASVLVDVVQPEVTNGSKRKRGFPVLPVNKEINKEEEKRKSFCTFLQKAVRLDHCYCRPSEISNEEIKTSPVSSLDKNERYWQRRKRNNAAARRSREAKRSKDIEMWQRAKYLENENAQLRKEINSLMETVAKNEKKMRLL